MPAWVKCEGISNDVIYFNVSQAWMMKPVESENCTNVTFANDIIKARARSLRFFPVTIRRKTQIYSVRPTVFVTWPTFATFEEAKKAAQASAQNPEAIATLKEESVVPLLLSSGQSRQKRPLQEIIYQRRK